MQRVLLIGAYPEALEVYRTVRRASAAGLVPVGIYVTEGASSVRNLDTPVPVFAGTDVVTCAEQLEADTLAVVGSASADAADLRRLAWQLEGTGRDLVVAPQLTDIAGPRVHIRPVEGLPLLHVEEPKISGIGWLIKNVLDISWSVLGLALLSPLFLGVAIAIKADSPGPVFFRQNRVGRDGETFSCWKFRTMYIDAEERQAALMMHNETDGLLFKMKDDPRITNVGKWLRRTSIDEFPQLINVVRGEMSLVGPRPAPRRERRLPRRRAPPPARAPRHHRPLAGLGPLRPVLGRRGPPRPLLRRQLVVDDGPSDPVPHRRCSVAPKGRVLSGTKACIEQIHSSRPGERQANPDNLGT